MARYTFEHRTDIAPVPYGQRPGPMSARYRLSLITAAALAIALATPVAQGPTATKPRIAVFSGPNATIQNNKPLVTSNKAREQYGLPMRTIGGVGLWSTGLAISVSRHQSPCTSRCSRRIRSSLMHGSSTHRPMDTSTLRACSRGSGRVRQTNPSMP